MKRKPNLCLLSGKRLRRRSNQDQHQDSDLSIALNDSQIERVRSHKFLGVEIDDDLTFENHCIALAQKVSKRIGLLKYTSPYLKSDHKNTYYNAIIKPVLLYGANIWTSTSKENLNNILRLQKRAARIILDAEPRSRTLPLFNALNCLPSIKKRTSTDAH